MFITLPATATPPKTILDTYQIVEVCEAKEPSGLRIDINYTFGAEVKVRSCEYDSEKARQSAFTNFMARLRSGTVPAGKFTNIATS